MRSNLPSAIAKLLDPRSWFRRIYTEHRDISHRGRCCLTKESHASAAHALSWRVLFLVHRAFELKIVCKVLSCYLLYISVWTTSDATWTNNLQHQPDESRRNNGLVHINEIRVLLVRHVPKGSCILRKSIHFSACSQNLSFPLLRTVLPDVHASQYDKDKKLDTVRHQERADPQTIGWSLVGLVEERAGDIADADAEPDHAGDDHFLGLPSCVGGD